MWSKTLSITDNHVGVSMVETCYLKFTIVLVGPKPWLRIITSLFSHHWFCGDFSLVDCISYTFNPKALTSEYACRAVAGSPNKWIRGSSLLIGDNSISNFEICLLRQFDRRRNTHSNNGKVNFESRSILQDCSFNMFLTVQKFEPKALPNIDTMVLM